MTPEPRWVRGKLRENDESGRAGVWERKDFFAKARRGFKIIDIGLSGG
jgi:hypothetical protein